jgi:hypothetical protein
MDKKLLTSPCGLACFNCATYEGNITEEWKKEVSEIFKIPVEETSCKGCRDEKGNCKFTINNECATWNCVQEKGVNFCYECEEFPCKLLAPSKKGADFLHNMKVYNLCRMKLNGIDNWIEEAGEIRNRYYEGEFLIGKGPILEE